LLVVEQILLDAEYVVYFKLVCFSLWLKFCHFTKQPRLENDQGIMHSWAIYCDCAGKYSCISTSIVSFLKSTSFFVMVWFAKL